MNVKSNPSNVSRSIAILGPVSVVYLASDYETVIPALLSRVPGADPTTLAITRYDGPIAPSNGPVWGTADRAKPVAITAKPVATIPANAIQAGPSDDRETIDADGKARAERDQVSAVRNGFVLGRQLFSTGTRLYQIGIANARAERLAWEELPSAGEALRGHAANVRAEDRRDVTIKARDVYMATDGQIASATWDKVDGRSVPSMVRPIGMPSEQAWSSIATRMGIPADSRCTSAHPIVRGSVTNAWATGRAHPTGARPDATIVMGTRRSGTGREVYRAVSEGYGDLDSGLVCEAFARAIDGSGARVSLDYDGQRTIARAIYHTNVPAERTVVGEVLQAWVGLRTDDTGGGSITVSAGIFHVLCRNLGHVRPEQAVARIRHVGEVGALARKFQDAIKTARSLIGDYVNAWNVATDDDLRAHEWVKEFKRASDHEFLSAIFRGLASKDEVVRVALASHASPAKLETTVRDLVSCVESDTSSATKTHGPSTRAAIVNAFTRYAHTASDVDPWQGEAIERAGSRLLFSDRPMPMMHPEDSDATSKRKAR